MSLKPSLYLVQNRCISRAQQQCHSWLGGLAKRQIASRTPRISDSVAWDWGLRTHISSKFPGDVDAAGLRLPPEEHPLPFVQVRPELCCPGVPGPGSTASAQPYPWRKCRNTNNNSNSTNSHSPSPGAFGEGRAASEEIAPLITFQGVLELGEPSFSWFFVFVCLFKEQETEAQESSIVLPEVTEGWAWSSGSKNF